MKLEVFQYQIPLKHTFSFNLKDLTVRKGFIFKWTYPSGVLYAEAAPLPPFSVQSFTNIKEWLNLHDLSKFLHIATDEEEAISFRTKPPPCIQFALDALRIQYQAVNNKIPLYSYLNQQAPSSVQLPVNKTLNLTEESDSHLDTITKWVNAGFKTFKFKVDQNVDYVVTLLKRVRQQFPDINIRLDANRSWSLITLTDFLSKLEDLNIEYIEEPLSFDSLSVLPDIAPGSTIPFAADESIRSIKDVHKVLKEDWADILILKPMLIGSITDILNIVSAGSKRAKKIVFSSSLESPIGHLITAHLATSQADISHGLATVDLFEQDFLPGSQLIREGYFQLNNGPGLGYDIENLINSSLLDIYITYKLEA